MRPTPSRILPLLTLLFLVTAPDASGQQATAPTPDEVLAASPDDAWRALDPERTVYLELSGGRRVVMELAPEFAPRHVENLRAMVRAGLFDGGWVMRSQDNYVVQWGPRDVADTSEIPEGIASELDAEFEVPSRGLPFTPAPDGDVYAPQAGFTLGFPAGRDPEAGLTWMLHCYGVVGVARSEDPNSGSGAVLYAVNGHAPRWLDRNLSMVGRIVSGMDRLSVLPRGTGPLGFYETEAERTSITSARLGSQLPPEERTALQVLRTDSPTFLAYMAARRSRTGPFWAHTAGRIDVCGVGIPTREGR